MKTVNFTQMKDGNKDEYLLLDRYEKEYINKTAERILVYLKGLTKTLEGYKISRLEHSLQTATRAFNDKAEEEMVVAALLHDIGDELAPLNHSEYAAAILKPYVTKKTHWIIEKHGEFQMYYYAHHLGKNKNLRDKYKDHEFYNDALNFCEKWDQASFDPNFKSMTLEDFSPMVKRIFSRKPYSFL
ncbi:HD domain-containing protein [Candidatus Pelagibacter communis]|uniref:HD domain-containing protein n=1 Tax=Pelagibacter ubique TaxID=198252 RepID=UPI00094CF314|nr:HD domain-containing protein [Candidatus Pelagibacter ubique]|tara:strand:- start:50 stop:607 length:558 start_codon:yes stop_codon:yes gene_type:complete